jgi:5-hydroxyisourate hydrolase-like protein (transthyretin family)
MVLGWAATASALPGGHILGTVTADTGGAPLEGFRVGVYEQVDLGDEGFFYVPGPDVFTDENGVYDVAELAAGTYRLVFYGADPVDGDVYATECYNDVPTSDYRDVRCENIVVGVDATVSGKDAGLADASFITGTVTADDGGGQLENVAVEAYIQMDDVGEGIFWDWVGSATTGSNGAYSIGGLRQGTYRLWFQAAGPVKGYVDECYDNVQTIDVADSRNTSFLVGSDTIVSGKNAALATAGHIEGTVTAETGGAPLEGVGVTAYVKVGANWEWLDSCSTDADGTYDLGGLPAGTYRLRFTGTSDYLGECYNDSHTSDIDDPGNTDISVGSAQHVTGKNAALSAAGRIKGKVTAQAGGSDLPDISIDVYRKNGLEWDQVAWESTDSTGTFNIGALQEGTYRLVFYDEVGEYAAECYDGVPGDDVYASGVDDIVVDAGATVLGKNASLLAASHITGRVTAKDGGAALPTITVEAYAKSVDASGATLWRRAKTVETSSTGGYDVNGLAAGDYRLTFHDGSSIYADECYNGVPGSNPYNIECDDITVGVGATASGKNAALADAADITGTVTKGVAPLDGITVNAYMQYDEGGGTPVFGYAGTGRTNDLGQYEIGCLGAGTYRLTFNEGSSGYSNNNLTTECYDNVPGANFTDPKCEDVVVSEGASVSGKNAELASGGSATIWDTGAANAWIPLPGGTRVAMAFDAATIGAVEVVTGGLPPAGPPRGFELAGTIFEISFSGTIAPGTGYRITLPYGSLFTADEARALKVGHWKSGVWEEITPLSVDTVQRTLTFDTASLSPFTLIKKTAIATTVSGARVSPSRPKRNKNATFSAVVSPPDALNAGNATLTLSQKLTKTVKVRYKSKGKWKTKKKKVTYYKVRKTVTAMSENAATGVVTATYKCKYKGSWKMDVTYSGDGSFTRCSTSKTFTVK